MIYYYVYIKLRNLDNFELHLYPRYSYNKNNWANLNKCTYEKKKTDYNKWDLNNNMNQKVFILENE